ncbi:single-stranded DNA-binding protein [Granulicatella sp. zg-ZJ]|uniref:single-stranded DNA-binding protein n=1 Tax=unclassified Granulicatella TaxID=2630493 RepID=UPI0013BF358C|nr:MULTISPECIES: single-stranded DNA-binding protein [unclassified Granulicatella]MBS4750234.1 single-stranded DNA-binding protein [Carnobacteriaceae bacterium zg-ZUI78]NEW62475.1 single-stranded DNA-binding protein [Granulicatella sp. zg-ZJ]NEW66853.1 single-stranded DNA-binding protein [Granulicatella sp. zg-84]QMI85829.1 single-stranded DNA-binding protein [Carnobacteriaceae bacterium zg-84]
MNVVSLVGRLTRDVELRYTPSGTAYGRFTLAVNRRVPNQQGVREADFINCVIWNKAAENLANYTHKGSQIGIQGRIQTGSYDNQQGQKVYTTDVVVENFDFLETKASSEQRPAQQNNFTAPSQNDFSLNNSQPDFETFDISDDDLPF